MAGYGSSEPSPIGWALRPLQRYAQFSGRAPRAEYWWYILAVTIAAFVLGMVDFAAFGGPLYGNLGPLGLTLVIATTLPGIALLIRRLHDTDRTGWWALIQVPHYCLILLGQSYATAGTVIGRLPGPALATAVILVLVWVVAVFFVFVRTISEGDEGPNRYGPDPYGRDELEEVFA